MTVYVRKICQRIRLHLPHSLEIRWLFAYEMHNMLIVNYITCYREKKFYKFTSHHENPFRYRGMFYIKSASELSCMRGGNSLSVILKSSLIKIRTKSKICFQAFMVLPRFHHFLQNLFFTFEYLY